MERTEPTRVLLDVLPSTGGEFDESFLSRNGLAVTTCGGPEGSGTCPLVAGHGCQRFEEANGIIFELDLDLPEHRAILQRYRELADEAMPIRVVVSPEQADRYRSELADVEVWTHEPTVAELDGFAARVEAATRSAP
ncbi:MAG TPA: hypothetical protein VMT43_00280 [Acidimicrobiales bacterium]|nr:hypothetical protein [Acidimicrobiales bacterium]